MRGTEPQRKWVLIDHSGLAWEAVSTSKALSFYSRWTRSKPEGPGK